MIIKKLPFIVLFSFSLLLNCIENRIEQPIHVIQKETPSIPLLIKEGVVKRGDTLEKLLLRENISRKVAVQIIKAFSDVFNVRQIKPRNAYRLFQDSTQTVHCFEYQAQREKTVRVVYDSTNSYTGQIQQIPLIKKTESLRGTVEITLYDAVLALNETPDIIIAFSDIFQWDIDFFTDPRRGDEFRIIFEKYFLQDTSKPDSTGEFVKYGKILAGQYTLAGTPMTAVYFQNQEGHGGYYDESGRSFQKMFLKSPLNYSRISSSFTAARRHPILKIVRAHYAIDYAAPTGTPVSASADGTIIEKGRNKGLGNYIKIRHANNRFITLYGHLSKFAKNIHKGKKVKQKDVIGYVGKTGLATGPHLHYALYENGRPVNPLKIKNTSGDPISTEMFSLFQKTKLGMLIQLETAGVQSKVNALTFLKPSFNGLGRSGLGPG